MNGNAAYTPQIILIGMMGAGKTTIGRALAALLNREFVDLDHEIIRRCGVSIPTIFDIEGEAGFRRRETQTLSDVMKQSGIVLATGGGAVLNPQNQALLRQGHIIYLHATVNELYRRIAFDKNRPLMATENPRQRIQTLLTERHPIYTSLADYQISTATHTVTAIARGIHQHLISRNLA